MSLSKSGVYKTVLLRKATQAYDDSRESDAIFYSTQALCYDFHAKFDAESRRLTTRDVDLTKLLDDLILPADAKEPDPVEGFNQLRDRCQQLPEQWTVLQINKSYTPRWNLLTHNGMLEESTSVDITLLSYSNSEVLDGKPLMVRLEPPEEKDFFPLVSSIPVRVKSTITQEINSGDRKQDEIESFIENVIERLTAWLGPWIALLSGKFISPKDQQFEAEIFNRVEDFCIVHNRSKRDQVLISLIARRLDILKSESIYQFCCHIANDRDDLREMYNFLTKLKASKFEPDRHLNCYPCLLLVDELLDGYPWEMMNTQQEFTRLGSFRMLWQLYETHKHSIKNGYLRVQTKTCHSIINPDKNLEKMSVRLQTFYKEWFPDFKLIVDQPPTNLEFSHILTEADVLIYNGHGSGLQFVEGDAILQCNIKSVVFLFGCDSVRLFPRGLFREMTGSHLYYNVARCPVVVGALWVMTDFYTDYYSILLVGSWISTEKSKNEMQSVFDLDPHAFKHGTLQIKQLSPDNGDENLLAIMADMRRRKLFKKRISCAMVCRGLPAINACFVF
ncbi:separin [Uranotaenia lowii]|uniref:separin n=1 Tax=Uranotaenia lowii TaxID=190385 RepID=UPI002479198F|nr:separin [Uranotaenia lowii]